MTVEAAKVWDGAAWAVAGAPTTPPTVSAVSQSTNYGGAGVTAADLTTISDGATEPFVATGTGTEWVKLTFAAPGYVTSVTIGASTGTGGWNSTYLNGSIVQISDDDSTWYTVQFLDGYTTAGASYDSGSLKTWPVGFECSYIRVARSGGYIAMGEFTIA